ncbi:MAG: P-loop ATPase, Sll1717 family [Candidatus Sulfotelmatobacter sp.]
MEFLKGIARSLVGLIVLNIVLVPIMVLGPLLYPTTPQTISSTIEAAVEELGKVQAAKKWTTWKDFGVTGQIIFCEICKAMRFTRLVVADVTTLNFNLLFEIGVAVGLGLPILPIRDTSFKRDQKTFDELGILDTLGYFDFQNSQELAAGVLARQDLPPLGLRVPALNTAQPLYVVKSPVENDGQVRLLSLMKRSGLKMRTFDPNETSRLSLHEAYKQVLCSRAVVLHLLAPERGEEAHNARCAFMAGVALAGQKHVLLLQEGNVRHPIDYRDIVKSYNRAAQIQEIVEPLILSVVDELQPTQFVPTALRLKPLEKVDLGDVAAENESRALVSYFVPTAEFYEAKRGHARLIVGRKGAGKTAVFYGVLSTYGTSKSHLVHALKPEGHQFIKFREAILKELSEGVQRHIVTAFWNYVLLMELSYQILKYDAALPYRDPRLRAAFEKIRAAYGPEDLTEQGDFSERLMKLVDQIAARRAVLHEIQTTAQITNLVHSHDIRKLNDALGEYLGISRREVWLLFDNVDKAWPVHGAKPEDILILKSLLEATRKLQREFEQRGVDLHAIVFVRNDIYQHLLLDPADRGKETAVALDWNDAEAFKEMIRRRIVQSTGIDLPFDQLWGIFFVSHVKGEPSFDYIVNRTLMRPREVLGFARECIAVGINRNHERVTEDDILFAEKGCSEGALVDIALELGDVMPEYGNVPYAFIGSPTILSRLEIERRIAELKISEAEFGAVVELLLWFGFLGIYVGDDDERYSYQFEHNPSRMQANLRDFSYCVHPAFRRALGTQ